MGSASCRERGFDKLENTLGSFRPAPWIDAEVTPKASWGGLERTRLSRTAVRVYGSCIPIWSRCSRSESSVAGQDVALTTGKALPMPASLLRLWRSYVSCRHVLDVGAHAEHGTSEPRAPSTMRIVVMWWFIEFMSCQTRDWAIEESVVVAARFP